MIKRALTYFTILAITVLPVQLISANAETVSMQVNMAQHVMANNECMHDMSGMNVSSENEQNSVSNTCCDEPSSGCQGCNDIPHATTAMTSPVLSLVQTSLINSSNLFADTSLLHGIVQKNLLRPPRSIV